MDNSYERFPRTAVKEALKYEEGCSCCRANVLKKACFYLTVIFLVLNIAALVVDALSTQLELPPALTFISLGTQMFIYKLVLAAIYSLNLFAIAYNKPLLLIPSAIASVVDCFTTYIFLIVGFLVVAIGTGTSTPEHDIEVIQSFAVYVLAYTAIYLILLVYFTFVTLFYLIKTVCTKTTEGRIITSNEVL